MLIQRKIDRHFGHCQREVKQLLCTYHNYLGDLI